MRKKILLTILLLSQLFTFGLALDYSINPVNPAQGASPANANQATTTAQCINDMHNDDYPFQDSDGMANYENGYCKCTTYGACDSKVYDSSLTNCQVLINGQDQYILLRADGCNNYAWGDSNQSVHNVHLDISWLV